MLPCWKRCGGSGWRYEHAPPFRKKPSWSMKENIDKIKPRHLITACYGWGRKPGQQIYNTTKWPCCKVFSVYMVLTC